MDLDAEVPFSVRVKRGHGHGYRGSAAAGGIGGFPVWGSKNANLKGVAETDAEALEKGECGGGGGGGAEETELELACR